MNRRTFAAGLLAGLASSAVARSQARTKLILLGTGGGPRPRAATMASAQVIVVGDRLYVVDSGDGVARQLVLAGLSLSALRHVFITHHHSDHNADYGNLLLLAWASGRRDRVDTWGPAPIAQITRLFLEMSATDIDTRIVDEGPAAARAAAARARAHPTRCGLAGRRRQSDRRVCQVPHG